ncbi:DUF1295 domain-containing protein [Oxalicibacterium faecigallinarum]|uniref:Steroid 5-alpha reductase n=1 Tax=Oxalicibacterium faecigallinarum TaxID=573741 RepID=A0A8J3F476_9BURK|nr:DUF1295 domain-containing protein [Oxalicibacterium faecigallinarum]GGI20584.1 steroid 5-alpha reductase [Oxalicibacterium faecigallinarum]
MIPLDETFWQPWLAALPALLVFAVAGWLYSIWRHNVHIIDSMWALYFLLTAICVALQQAITTRGILILCVAMIWGLRLSTYLTFRNWGKPEDYRYQQIRKNNAPHFWIKSLYLVFGFQMVLAWCLALPLIAAMHSTAAMTWLDITGLAIALIGIVYEGTADWQLYCFKQNPANKGKVLDHGLWAWSRHPNYFGESLTWWGFFIVALASGHWWTVFSPIILTILLLKVSGVRLLEKTIHERRPAYREYIARTSSFIPWPPKQPLSRTST